MASNRLISLFTFLIVCSISISIIEFQPSIFKQAMAQIGSEYSNDDDGFSTYTDSTYGIKINYPSNWEINKDNIMEGYRSTTIVTFFSPLESPDDIYQEYVSVVLDNLNYNADLNEYLQESIDSYKVEPDYELVESNTDSQLAGNQAYLLVYASTYEDEENDMEYDLSTLEVGTIIDNKGYFIDFVAEEDVYSDYLETAQTMIDSFEITNLPNTNNNDLQPLPNENTSIENKSSPSIQESITKQLPNGTTKQLPNGLILYENPTYEIKLQYPSDWQITEEKEQITEGSTSIVSLLPRQEENNPNQPLFMASIFNSNSSFDLIIEDQLNYLNTQLEESEDSYEVLESTPTNAIVGNSTSSHLIIYKHGDSQTGILWEILSVISKTKDNKVYLFQYTAEESQYSKYLPTVLNILKSIEFTSIYDDSTNNQGEQQEQQYRVPLRSG